MSSKDSINSNVIGLSKSATLAINERCKNLIREGRKIYNMGLGQSPFPVPTPVVEELKAHASEKDYLPVKGLLSLRRQVAKFQRLKDRVDVNADGVMVGPGSKELLFLLHLVFDGDIIIPTPCWVSYIPQARITGRRVILIQTSYEQRWQMTAQSLKEVCELDENKKPKILVLNSPANPYGGSHDEEELQKIADVAREYGVLILSDEIYGQLHHKGDHVSIARFYPEGTIISSGISKWCGAGGWRLGTFTFPKELSWLMDSMAVVASETYTSVSAPIQYAAVKAFKGGIRIERYLCHVRRILDELGRACAQKLLESGVRLHPPTGAFYLFVDFELYREKLEKLGITDSKSLCEQLLQDTGVAILPGVHFERHPEELTARIAYVNFDGAEALAASEMIPLDQKLPDDFLTTRCGDVLEATDKISQWLKSL